MTSCPIVLPGVKLKAQSESHARKPLLYLAIPFATISPSDSTLVSVAYSRGWAGLDGLTMMNESRPSSLVGVVSGIAGAFLLLYCWVFLVIPLSVGSTVLWIAYLWLPETLTPLAPAIAVLTAHVAEYVFLSYSYGTFDPTFDILVTVCGVLWLMLQFSPLPLLLLLVYNAMCLHWYSTLIMASPAFDNNSTMSIAFILLELMGIIFLMKGYIESRRLLMAEQEAASRESLSLDEAPIFVRIAGFLLPVFLLVVLGTGNVRSRFRGVDEFLRGFTVLHWVKDR